MINEIKIGPQTGSDTALTTARGDKSGSTVVAPGAAPYEEACYRGQIFFLDADAVTAAAANATKSALGTVKFLSGFYNPSGSGKLAVILAAHVATTSGTPGGPYFYNYITGIVVTSTTTGTVRAGYLGGSAASVMLPAVNVAITVSGGATTALTQLGVLGGPAAIAAGAGIYDAYEEIGGRIIVPPGSIFGITVAAAGTSHVTQSTLTWKEIAL